MYDNCFFMCMENQNIFLVTHVCTEQTQKWCDSMSDVRTVNYPAEQGESIMGETGGRS